MSHFTAKLGHSFGLLEFIAFSDNELRESYGRADPPEVGHSESKNDPFPPKSDKGTLMNPRCPTPICAAARSILEESPHHWQFPQIKPIRDYGFEIPSIAGDAILQFTELSSGYYLTVQPTGEKRKEFITGISLTSERTSLTGLFFYDPVLFIKVAVGMVHRRDFPGKHRYSCFVETPYLEKFQSLSPGVLERIRSVLELSRSQGRAVISLANRACSLYVVGMTETEILRLMRPSIEEFLSIRLWEL